MRLLIIALLLTQAPAHRRVMQPNLPTKPTFVDGFQAFLPGGLGTSGECSPTPPVGYWFGVPVTLTITQATPTWCPSNDGQRLTLMSANQPRVSSGTAASSVLGVWKERAATNAMAVGSTRDFTAGAWVKTNVTCAKNVTGMDGVANSASTCTATAPGGTVCQPITYGAATNNSHGHIQRAVGSGTIEVARDAATYTNITSSLSSTIWRRVVSQEVPGCAGGNCIVVSALSSGIANPSVCIRFGTSGDAVRLDFWGDEGGAVATSPISGASHTRDGDILDFALPFSPTVAGGGFSMSATMVSARVFTGGSTTIPLVLGNGTLGSTAGPTVYAWLYSINAGGLAGFDTAGVVSGGTATLNQMWTDFTELETNIAGYHTGAAINSCQRGVCALASASTLGTPAFTRLLLGRYSGASGTNHMNGVIKNIIVGAAGVAIPPAPTGRIVWIGDSIVFGNGSMPMTPPVHLSEQRNQGVVAAGVGSNTAAQCGARWTSTYKGRGFNMLIWSCAVNDLAAGTGGLTTATAVKGYLLEARAEGMRVVVTGVMPWKNSTGWTAGKQAETVAYNTEMSAWSPDAGVIFLSTATMGGQGGDPDLLQTALQSTALDKIHPNSAGAAHLARIVADGGFLLSDGGVL